MIGAEVSQKRHFLGAEIDGFGATGVEAAACGSLSSGWSSLAAGFTP